MTPRSRHELPLPTGEKIVLDWVPPTALENQVAVFVHGLGSNRRGDKALHFADRFAELGWGFLAVDLRGHGESGGSLEDLTITRCVEDLGAAIAWLPDRAIPRLLIGSSMGGAVVSWFDLLHPASDRYLALIAPSFHFPSRFAELSPEELAVWKRTGLRRFTSEWVDLQFGYCLVEDSANYAYERLVRDHVAPTLILHGMRDTAVPWMESVSFIEQASSNDVALLLIKNGDHRLTDDKAYLFDAIVAWLRKIKPMR